MPFRLACSCGQRISVPDHAKGRQGKCPRCGKTLSLLPEQTAAAVAPAYVPEAARVEPAAARFPCPSCGESIPELAKRCRFCGHTLALPPAAPVPDYELRRLERERRKREESGKGFGWFSLLLSLGSVPAFMFLLFSKAFLLPLVLILVALVLAVICLVGMKRKLLGICALLACPLAAASGVFLAFACGLFWAGQQAEVYAVNETGAEKALRTLIDAQATFMKAKYDGGVCAFCDSLAGLHGQPDPAGYKIALITETLAGGTKDGYAFSQMATFNPGANGADRRYGFAYCAVPTAYGDTGRRTYITRQTGEIWYKDQGASTVVTDWTWADDAALILSGWTRLGE